MTTETERQLQQRTNELLIAENQLVKAREHILALIQKHPDYGTNKGCGHVWERPDGRKARCSGLRHCTPCREANAVILRTIEDARQFADRIG